MIGMYDKAQMASPTTKQVGKITQSSQRIGMKEVNVSSLYTFQVLKVL